MSDSNGELDSDHLHVEVTPMQTNRPKICIGIPPAPDPLQAQQVGKQVEAMLQPLFPGHDIVVLIGFSGMMEVRG